MPDSNRFYFPEPLPLIRARFAGRYCRRVDTSHFRTGGISIVSLDRLSPTAFRVNFSGPVLNSVALRNPANYVLTPALEVFAVTPDLAVGPRSVVLNTSEQIGVLYTLRLYNAVEAA